MHPLEDESKDIDLEANGIYVQRFTNEQVLNDIDRVMICIHETLSKLRIKHRSLDDDRLPN